jgi:hypothetical protein
MGEKEKIQPMTTIEMLAKEVALFNLWVRRWVQLKKKKPETLDNQLFRVLVCGEGGIRTPGRLPYASFQD